MCARNEVGGPLSYSHSVKLNTGKLKGLMELFKNSSKNTWLSISRDMCQITYVNLVSEDVCNHSSAHVGQALYEDLLFKEG